jgi:hypothetical protein
MVLDVFTPEECLQIVQAAEAIGFEKDEAAGGSATTKASVRNPPCGSMTELIHRSWLETLFGLLIHLSLTTFILRSFLLYHPTRPRLQMGMEEAVSGVSMLVSGYTSTRRTKFTE